MRGIKRLDENRYQITLRHRGRLIRRILPSRRMAVLVRQKILTALAEGRYLNIKKTYDLSFARATEIFLNHSRDHLSASQYELDQCVVAKCLRHPAFRGKAASAITAKDIYDLKETLAATDRFEGTVRHVAGVKLSKRSVDIVLSRLSRMFSLLGRMGYLTENPAKNVPKYNIENLKTRILSMEEEPKLLEACPPYLRGVVVLALYSGMRLNEVLGLTWGDVAEDSSQVSVPAYRSKNRRSRVIPLPSRAKELLEGLRPPDAVADTLVFLSPKGGRIVYIHKTWGRILKRSGIVGVTFHSLRHSFASRAVMAGISLYSVKELLGHSSFFVTQRYAHLAPSHLSADMALFSQKYQ